MRTLTRPWSTPLLAALLAFAAGCPDLGIRPPDGDRPPTPRTDANPADGAPVSDARASADAPPYDAGAPPDLALPPADAPPTADASADAPAPADASADAPSPPDVPPPPANVAAVWAIGDGEKFERDDTQTPAVSSVWDGKTIKLFAAKNEIVAVQILVRANDTGIARLSARLPSVDRIGGGGRIEYAPPASDPSLFQGRPINLYTVNYLPVTRATNASWIYTAGEAAPPDPMGLKPVQLVPENARAGRGGWPLTVAPRQNQALWVDIYVPRDRAAGFYEGTVTITADGGQLDLPIELEVLDFALPDKNALSAMVYYESSQTQLYQGRDLDAAYHRFGHRQRIELVHAYNAASVGAAIGRFHGTDFTSEAGYEGPGENTGNRIVPASFYSPGSGWSDRASAWQKADAWMSFLDQTVPDAITFLYMPDEPSASQYPGIRAIADNVHSNPGPGKRLPIFVTKGFTPELDGAIDIWCSGPRRFEPPRVAEQRAQGRRWWTYNGGRPHGPALVIDAPGTDARVIGWASFKAAIDVYFYWHANHWRHNGEKQTGDRNQNIWANPITFDKRDGAGSGSFANGDGVLLYPGTDALHAEEDRGIAGPISTVQLANLRRGIQDHLYLTLARQRGLEPLVGQALEAIVPKVFSDAQGRVSFPETTTPFEDQRLILGRALAKIGN